MFRHLKSLRKLNFTRFISLTDKMQQPTSCGSGGGKLPEKLKRLQKLFQAKNNLPVFLKGGSNDKILYYTTLGLCGLGLTLNVALYASYIID